MKRNLLLVYCVVLTLAFLFIPLIHIYNVGGENLGFIYYAQKSYAEGDSGEACGYMASFFTYILIFALLSFRWVKMAKWLSLLTFVSPAMALSSAMAVADNSSFSNAGYVIYVLLNAVFVILCLTLKSHRRTDEKTVPCKSDPQADALPGYDRNRNVAQHKGISVCAYLGILVLIPLFGGRDSRFVRFHANQGLVLLVGVIAGFVLRMILWHSLWMWLTGAPWRWLAFNWFFSLVTLFFIVLAIIGIIHVLRGQEKRLPLIGKIRLLK